MRILFLIVLTYLWLPASIAEVSSGSENETSLVFSLGYVQTVQSEQSVIVQLGQFKLMSGGVAVMEVFHFNASSPTIIDVQGRPHPPSNNTIVCGSDASFRVPEGSEYDEIGNWSEQGDTLTIRFGKLNQRWEKSSGGYVLRTPFRNDADGSHNIDGIIYGPTRGFAYLTATQNILPVVSPMKDNFFSTYSNQRYEIYPTSFSKSWKKLSDVFWRTNDLEPTSPGMLSELYAGSAQGGGGRRSILFNYSSYSSSIFYSSYANDPQTSGCYSNELLSSISLGIWKDGRVDKMLYLRFFEKSGSVHMGRLVPN